MGRRARKKNKEIIGMDTDSVWYKRNNWWQEQMRKKFKKLKFPSIRKKTVVWDPIADDFKGGLFRKAKANSRIEELLTPIMEDYPREFEQNIIMTSTSWHIGHQSLEQVQQAVEETRHCRRSPCDVWKFVKTGLCAICNSMLTNKFPEDYPDDWKFCCTCKSMAEEIAKGALQWDRRLAERADKILDKITLVWK